MALTRKNHLDTLAIALLLGCCMLWGAQQVLVKATVAEVAASTATSVVLSTTATTGSEALLRSKLERDCAAVSKAMDGFRG